MMPRTVRLAAIALAVCAGLARAGEDPTDQVGDDTSWHDFSTTPEWSEPVPAKSAQQFPPVTPAFSPVVPSAHQPSGALSGRVVFMNSGHGWTWYTNGWNLQRPVALNSMNEDYGNLDQLNFFAAYCFNAGAIVASMRPLGQQTNEVVIDNVDAGVTFAGAWSDSTSTVYFGKPGDVPYRYAAFDNTESATATYTPTIPVRRLLSGLYLGSSWLGSRRPALPHPPHRRRIAVSCAALSGRQRLGLSRRILFQRRFKFRERLRHHQQFAQFDQRFRGHRRCDSFWRRHGLD